MMFVRIKVREGRRVRDRFTQKIMVAGEEARVKWDPTWERRKRDGDIEMLDDEPAPKTHPSRTEVTE